MELTPNPWRNPYAKRNALGSLSTLYLEMLHIPGATLPTKVGTFVLLFRFSVKMILKDIFAGLIAYRSEEVCLSVVLESSINQAFSANWQPTLGLTEDSRTTDF